MEQLIAEHADLVYLIFLGMGGLLVYFYKGNESKNALLLAGKLDVIAEKLDVLFEKDEKRAARIAKLEKDFVQQRQRCDDRESACPGREAQRALIATRDR